MKHSFMRIIGQVKVLDNCRIVLKWPNISDYWKVAEFVDEANLIKIH